MSIPDSRHSDSTNSNARHNTTRRGLFAAAAVVAAMMAQQKAHAMGRWPHRDQPGDNSCFLRGTRILTPKGEVRVEELAIGDLLTTIDGTAKPIAWVGSTSLSAAKEQWPGETLPIKVARSALAPLIPHTDLYLSSFHAIYLEGLLVPVRNLVNGRSIVHCTSVDANTVEYFHVKLEEHDVIFSEGAPTETLEAQVRHDELGTLVADPSARAVRTIAQHEQLFAPRLPVNRSAVIRSRLRSAVAPWIDVRQPADAIWDRLAERAETQLGA